MNTYGTAVYSLNGNLDGIYNETDDLAEAKESARQEANSSEYPYGRAEVVKLDGNGEWDTMHPVAIFRRGRIAKAKGAQ